MCDRATAHGCGPRTRVVNFVFAAAAVRAFGAREFVQFG
jgi:hypothetical protein